LELKQSKAAFDKHACWHNGDAAIASTKIVLYVKNFIPVKKKKWMTGSEYDYYYCT